MIDHADVRSHLELASLEPGGLERLAGGDAPDSAAIAGHLAGCPACQAELDDLRRTIALVRVVVADAPDDAMAPATGSAVAPPPELKARTMSLVRELGVRRTGLPDARPLAPAPSPAQPPVRAIRLRPVAPSAWLLSVAAAVIVSVVATASLVGGSGQGPGGGSSTLDANELASIASWTVRVAAAPDARQVGLAPVAGGTARGSLTYAASTGALVVIADGLDPAPSGQVYRCWLETPAGRTAIGRMYVARNIAYWVGNVTSLGSYPAGTRFGVSLEPATGTGVGAPAVLAGTL